MNRFVAALAGLGLLLAAAPAGAALTIVSQFDPAQAAGVCGLAVESGSGAVWIHECNGTTVQRYSSAGAFLGSVPRPGESTNDLDVEIVHQGFTLESTALPAGAMLFVNGESGAAEVHGVHPGTGAVLEVLPTLFGTSHVVGGAWHPVRNTLFLLQDRNGAGAQANRVAEIDAVTGAVINSFSIAGLFDVNYGDIDICASSGNLFLVSSFETSIAEFTPAGVLVQLHPLPAGVSTLSGIGYDDTGGHAWVGGIDGNVWRLGGLPCAAVAVPPGPRAVASLGAARPNPSSGGVSLRCTLEEDAAVAIVVYDAAGRRVRALAAGTLAAGTHDLRWDARDDRGERVRPGVYFYRVIAGAWRGERRCVIVTP